MLHFTEAFRLDTDRPASADLRRLCAAALLALLAPLVATAPARAETFGDRGPRLGTCSDIKARFGDLPCSLDAARFRKPDPRLAQLPTEPGGTSPLFKGREVRIANAGDALRLKGKLKPGDQVLLAAGDWTDQAVFIYGEGTQAAPIVVRPERPGAVVFRGGSFMALVGAHIILHDLAFVGGPVPKDHFAVLRVGNGNLEPCDYCMVHRVRIDGVNAAVAQGKFRVWYLLGNGRDITVARSEFLNKRNPGTMILFQPPKVVDACPQQPAAAGSCFQRLHFFLNRISGYAAGTAADESERKMLVIGSSEVAARASYSIVENNLFENGHGDNSTVTVKISDVIIRSNVFRRNLGTLNIRSGDRVVVANNVFDGTGIDSMGGVRMSGRAHIIAFNTFRGLQKPKNLYYAPLALHAATDENQRDNIEDYARAKQILILGNDFANVDRQSIRLGIFAKPAAGRSLPPKDVFVIGNRFGTPAAPAAAGANPIRIEDGVSPEGLVVRDNSGG
jgi:poly(beta-D-mannuronate) lyase